MKNALDKKPRIEDSEIKLWASEIVVQKSILPGYMFFYSDLIEPRIVGDALGRVLLTHPLRPIEQIYQSVNILNVQYCKLEKSRIVEINILITDETGEQINFKNDIISTMILLHFRKGI